MKSISKRKLEIGFYDKMYEELNMPLFWYEGKQNINKFDLEDNLIKVDLTDE